MSENISLEPVTRSLEDATRVLTGMGMTRVEAAKTLMLTEIFLDVRVEMENRKPLTVSYRKGLFTTQGGETVREVESLDEQALQEQGQAVQFELFAETPPEDSWEPSPPEAFRVFEEYDDLTGEFDE